MAKSLLAPAPFSSDELVCFGEIVSALQIFGARYRQLKDTSGVPVLSVRVDKISQCRDLVFVANRDFVFVGDANDGHAEMATFSDQNIFIRFLAGLSFR